MSLFPSGDLDLLRYCTQQSYRSINSLKACKIQFLNKSSTNVDIHWLDYSGKEVPYFTLKPQNLFVINSFVTHPWVFRDKARRSLMPIDVFKMDKNNYLRTFLNSADYNLDKLMVKSTRILFPMEHNSQQYLHVVIRNDVLSLKEWCFRLLVDNYENIDYIVESIPQTIANELMDYKNGQKLEHIYGTRPEDSQ